MKKIVEQMCIEKYAGICAICGDTGTVLKRLYEKRGEDHMSNLVLLCKKCFDSAEHISKNYNPNRVGVLLCGGKGTRLYPLTSHFNKHSLPIGLSFMVSYPLRTLRQFGVKKVLIVVDKDSGPEIINIIGSGKAYGMDVSYKAQEGAGGISEALYLAKDFVREDTEEIVVILGDNIFDDKSLDTSVDLTSLDKVGFPENEACVYLKQVSNPEDYGIAVLDKSGKVTKIVEKPKEFIGDTAVLGLYVYKPSVFDVIEGVDPSDRGELEISSVNDYYAARGTLDSKVFCGYWGDAGGSIRRYAECNMHGAKQAKVSAEEIDVFRSIVFDDK